MPTSTMTAHRPGGRVLLGLLVLFTAGCGSGGSSQSSSELLRVARLKIAAGEYDAAIEQVSAIPQADAQWADAQLVVGDALMRQQRFAEALEVWQGLLDDSSAAAKIDHLHTFAGQCSRELGRLDDAEHHFRQALRQDDSDTTALANLAFLLSGSGRVWEAGELYRRQLQIGASDFDSLVLLADLERPIELHAFFEQWADRAESDSVVARGLAAHAFWDGKSAEARQRLTNIVAKRPEFVASQAMLGELRASGSVSAFRDWWRQLPEAAWDHPGVWYACGLFARTHGDLETAGRCFVQAVKHAPTHRRAFHALGQSLYALEHPAADDVGDYAAVVVSVGAHVDDVLRAKTPDRFRKVVDALVKTGRYWEACAWSVEAMDRFPESAWPQQVIRQYFGRLETVGFVAVEAIPQYCRNDQPAPDLAAFFRQLPATEAVRSSQPGAVRFDDSIVAIPFQYQNGHDPTTPGARFFEQTGGGVSVIDLDADSWPDLFFTQGGQLNPTTQSFERSSEEQDTLYRNQRGQFTDVRRTALPADIGFGQGASAGDINNDGFADLYVGNYERNQLLINMGDGTFRSVESDQQSDNEFWTASTAIADLNQDGHPDLIDINYLAGPELLSAICNGKACSPASFDAAPDFIRVNRGDGTFVAQPGAANSKGLGSVVWQDPVDRSMVLFISNDQVANVCLKFEPTDYRAVAFNDLAVPVGLAFNEDGNRMGCMGIAASDLSGNGLLDLFVTNFQNEANTLYVQDAPGLFIDQTKTSGLFPVSYQMVGWGVQSLDADRDGHRDLVLTNGHVDDHRDQGKGYHMRPQFFRNRGGAQFSEADPGEVGSYFARKFLGRGLARFDWNRDHADDFVVSNIRQPASVVTNLTEPAGHFLNVRLCGTTVARDAIGATVELETAAGTQQLQLTGGDGFMATNERRLQFGLGPEDRLRRVTVIWPDDSRTVTEDLSVDTEVVIVQDQAAFVLPPEE